MAGDRERQCLLTGHTGCIRGPGILLPQVFLEHLLCSELHSKCQGHRIGKTRSPSSRNLSPKGGKRTDIINTVNTVRQGKEIGCDAEGQQSGNLESVDREGLAVDKATSVCLQGGSEYKILEVGPWLAF